MSDKRSYRNAVEEMARDILTEHGVDEDNWNDVVSENVDSSSWIIYYGNNEEVLDNTDNEPDNDEIMGMARKDGTWRDLRQTAAFLAMERDVMDKLRELAPEYEPSYYKVKSPNGSFLTNNDIARAKWWHECNEVEDGDEMPTFEPENDEEARYDDKDDADQVEEWLEGIEIVAFNTSDEEVAIPE